MSRIGRPFVPLRLEASQKKELALALKTRKLPADLHLRLRIILLCAEGLSPGEVCERLGVTHNTVTKWRRRYEADGIATLGDLPRSGRPRSFKEERVAQLLRQTIETKPEGATHWSIRSFALEHGVSKSSVQRIWSEFALKPHRQESFKLSEDPLFVEKVVDSVGLYLNPPANALVLCVDEKSQIQALERTQPSLPMGLGYAEGYTHDYVRHGTTTLFAALNAANGKVLSKCRTGHRHEQFLDFLRHIDSNTPAQLDLHIVLDNYATHKHPKVRAWLTRHPRFQLHFTPTYCSWLNQVEIFFGIVTRKAIRRGTFQSLAQLNAAIVEYIDCHNRSPRPFRWTASADCILGKVAAICNELR